MNSRYPIVDLMKALAIFLMVFFHLNYDLTLFGFTQVDFFNNPFWFYLPRFIVSLFLISSGASLVFAHKLKFDNKKYLIRSLKLLLFALIISLSTYLFDRDRWVFMGTLHCLFITGLIGIFFIQRPKLSLILSCVVLILVLMGYDTAFLSRNLGTKSMDFIPPYPWMGMVWFGIFLGHQNLLKYQLKKSKFLSFCQTLSHHSLKIYLVHQPILISLIYGLKKIVYKA